MTSPVLPEGAFLLYRSQPAQLLRSGGKLEIELLESGNTQKVRPKDVVLLHPGPVTTLEQLSPTEAELDEARELLEGEESNLEELAGLLFNRSDPSAVWSAWQVVSEGLHFQGTPHRFRARSEQEYQQEKKKREERQQRRKAWQEFLDRATAKKLRPEDEIYLRDTVDVALGRGRESRLLQHLQRQQSRENAHALLLELGWWQEIFNPHPRRLGFDPDTPEAFPEYDISTLDEPPRRDLCHLQTFAIDDEGSQDPDDAISFDGERIWIHVADVAALVPPDSPLDLAAQERAATLYLPEATLTMLPDELTDRLALGLDETSPALSFALKLGPEGSIAELEIVSSRIRVRRLSYRDADAELAANPALQALQKVAAAHRRQRAAGGAVNIEMPECRIRVVNGEIQITPLPRYHSRELVSELMLMTGSAVADYAKKHQIALPYAGQPLKAKDDEAASPAAPPTPEPAGLTEMYALRCTMRPGRISCTPQPHGGLGLEAYTRVTSPLRRYLDLVTHQQLRRHLAGDPLLDENTILTRIAAVGERSNRIRQAERLSNRHWTLLYLKQRPDWRGTGVVLDNRGRKSRLIIPELALEWEQNLPQEPPPGTRLELHSPRVNLPWLEIFFQSS